MKINHNVLTINDIESPVSYIKSGISNDFSYKINYTDLLSVFNENPNDIFKYDTSGCFSIITIDDQEISLNKYTNQPIKFFKITNDILTKYNSDILLSVNHLKCYKDFWQNKQKLLNTDIPEFWKIKDSEKNRINAALSYVNGYEVCQKILSNTSQMTFAYAVQYCNTLNIDGLYQGYLPSLYQLSIINEYRCLINYVIGYFRLNCNNIDKKKYWSCIEWDAHATWILTNEGKFGAFSKHNNDYWILPIFKAL